MTVHARNRLLVEPDWMRSLPKNARLTAPEVMCVFGVDQANAARKDVSNARAFIARGSVPEPTHQVRLRGRNAFKMYWEVAFLRRHMCLHNKEVRSRLEEIDDNKTVPRNGDTTTAYPASFDRELYGE